jgi:serine/threonine protein kinase
MEALSTFTPVCHPASLALKRLGLESKKCRPNETGESDFRAGAIDMSDQIYGETIDRRSDMYSLGVLLYRLATGPEPVTVETLASLAARLSPLFEPSLAYIQVWMDQLILLMLEKDPAARLHTAQELIQCLNRRSITTLEYRAWLDNDVG